MREIKIGLVAYSPLGRGFLTVQLHTLDDFADDDYLNYAAAFILQVPDTRVLENLIPAYRNEPYIAPSKFR